MLWMSSTASSKQVNEMILHMHNHAGWFTQKIDASCVKDALVKGLDKRAGFLSAEYTGRYRVEHDNPDDEYPKFRVIWDDDIPKTFVSGFPLQKGDVWWSDRFQIGQPDDCQKCGGTGRSHYTLIKQCWACGDKNKKGRGSGKEFVNTAEGWDK